jgi:hypothetical protein
MEDYPHPVIDFEKYQLSYDELKQQEIERNKIELKQKIKIKGKIINTLGELKPYMKNYKTIEKFYDFLDEEDYIYIYNWFQLKEENIPF